MIAAVALAVVALTSGNTYMSGLATSAARMPVAAVCADIDRSYVPAGFDVAMMSKSDCADLTTLRKLGPRLPERRFLRGPWNLLHETGHLAQLASGLPLDEHDAQCRALAMYPRLLAIVGVPRRRVRGMTWRARDAVVEQAPPYGGICA